MSLVGGLAEEARAMNVRGQGVGNVDLLALMAGAELD